MHWWLYKSSLHFNHLNDITNTIPHYIYISSNHHAFGYISTRHEEERSENTISVIYPTKKKGGGGILGVMWRRKGKKNKVSLTNPPFFPIFIKRITLHANLKVRPTKNPSRII